MMQPAPGLPRLGQGAWEDGAGTGGEGGALARGGDRRPLDPLDVDADRGQRRPVESIESGTRGFQVGSEGLDRAGLVEHS